MNSNLNSVVYIIVYYCFLFVLSVLHFWKKTKRGKFVGRKICSGMFANLRTFVVAFLTCLSFTDMCKLILLSLLSQWFGLVKVNLICSFIIPGFTNSVGPR